METFFKNLSAEDGTTKKLIQDLHVLIADAEELVTAASGNLASKSREELLQGLEKMKSSCRRLEKRATAGARDVDRFIRENPYQAIGMGFGAGLLLGVILGRD